MNSEDNDSHAKFFEAYGRAALTWQSVEHQLFLIFSTLMRAPDPKAVAGIYHAVINLRARLQMIDAAVNASLKPVDKVLWEDWKGVRRVIDTLAAKRNDLAHMTLVGLPEDDVIYLRLQPSIFIDTGGGPTEYKVEDIEFATQEFRDLEEWLKQFGDDVVSALPRPSR